MYHLNLPSGHSLWRLHTKTISYFDVFGVNPEYLRRILRLSVRQRIIRVSESKVTKIQKWHPSSSCTAEMAKEYGRVNATLTPCQPCEGQYCCTLRGWMSGR